MLQAVRSKKRGEEYFGDQPRACFAPNGTCMQQVVQQMIKEMTANKLDCCRVNTRECTTTQPHGAFDVLSLAPRDNANTQPPPPRSCEDQQHVYDTTSASKHLTCQMGAAISRNNTAGACDAFPVTQDTRISSASEVKARCTC